jgi:hypothetical protein
MDAILWNGRNQPTEGVEGLVEDDADGETARRAQIDHLAPPASLATDPANI